MKTMIAAVALMTTSTALADTPPPSSASQATTALDPARVALARQIMAKILPPAATQAFMHSAFDQIPMMTVKQTTTMPGKRLLIAAGVPAETANKISMENVMQAEKILDPSSEPRLQITMRTMMDGMIDAIAKAEPILNEAMVSAYARHFDRQQLTDILTFFNTRSGTAYAAGLITLTQDPGIRDAQSKLGPLIMASMPDALQKAKAATDALPKPRDPHTVTDAEWRTVGQLLGCDPVQLKQAAMAKAQ